MYYAIKMRHNYPSRKYSKSESAQMLKQVLIDSISRIKPEVSNHLFRRTPHKADDFFQFHIAI